MQALIVHDDVEVGEQLLRMVQDYTSHDCDFVSSDATALLWAREHARCRLLLTQLAGSGVDGLALAASLSETFPGIQTLFLPAYPASEQRLDNIKTKVFPEPIAGEALLEVIEAAASTKPGAPDLFHVLDVLQMCCLGRRNGAVQIVRPLRSGVVFLRDGKMVQAESTAARGTEALLEIAAWDMVEFAYDESVRAEETIAIPWDEAFLRAVGQHKEGKRNALAPPEDRPLDPAVPPAKPGKRGLFGALRKN
jgi:CheY-like chemotaxis protein